MTDFLFAMPSFIRGAAHVLDIGGTLDVYNRSRDGAEADRRAIQADWAAVSQDMWCGVKQVEQEIESKQNK